jgi:hypothetical protein
VCDTSIAPTRSTPFYDFVEKTVDCLALFESPVLEKTLLEDAEVTPKYVPPNFCEMPNKLRDEFTHGGKLKVS